MYKINRRLNSRIKDSFEVSTVVKRMWRERERENYGVKEVTHIHFWMVLHYIYIYTCTSK